MYSVQQLITFMNDYGYLVLFLSLILGILALPIPIEALMGYAGFLSYKGQLNWFLCLLAAGAGCTLGMIFAYLIGFKLGMPFFEKYGKRLHLGPERMNSTSIWFKKYGNKLLIIALFIPGIRHLTGYFSGITRLPFRIFTFYSAFGSIIWVSTFILLGKLLGPKWQVFHEVIKKYVILGSIILGVIITLVFLFRRYRNEIIQLSIRTGKQTIAFFHSRKKAEFFIAGLSIVTIGFIILMIGIIQDFLSNEIRDFDKVMTVIVTSVFSRQITPVLNFFVKLGSSSVLLSVIFYTLIIIFWKGKEKLLEVCFLAIAIAGGEIYEDVLRGIFSKLAPNETPLLERFPYSFPSEQSLMGFVVYGFLFFILIRYSKSIRIHTLFIFIGVFILLGIGIGRIYLNLQAPSQIAAGYVFGGVWLGITTVLLEIFRLLTYIDPARKRGRVR
jgi:membrane protein DedA with SNARE-associated domain